MNELSVILLALILLPLANLYLLVLAAVRVSPLRIGGQPRHRMAIAIPAHNEAAVIGRTVATLRQLDYPPEMYDVHVVADHCDDDTAEIARIAGATVHERLLGPRGGKGAAMRWLLTRVLGPATTDTSFEPYDALVVFDADTRASPDFLRIMDARLSQGDPVIQGQHRISNPHDGWFAALTWAMFLVDNRFQNQGRSNLGWSAKHMGDSICFRADILRRLGWGEGLTEDYQLRQQCLLEGIKISYEPAAIGYGEAPASWAQARAQRARWLRGTLDASRRFARSLLVEGLKRRDLALLDGALQAYLPSYSTLSLIAVAMLASQLLVNQFVAPVFQGGPVFGWAAACGALFAYPLIGLAMEKAPLKAYLAILSGPFFIVWRSWLALLSRLGHRQVVWVRTEHGRKREA